MKKNLYIRFFLFTFCFALFIYVKAQDSSHIRVSLLTCTPGEELYSTFGHSAIRITDSSSVTDIVFNYGTFNFDDPNFYTKFIRGKLLYYVSAEDFEDFKYAYQSTNRGITEQVMNLSPDEKIAITNALFDNIRDENKYYKYDFFFDNCTTRVRDILFRYKKGHQELKSVVPPNFTFRNAIHQYLDNNGKYWSKLGIDILLGSPTDAKMNITTSQFLPDNLMKVLDSSNQNNHYVKSSQNLYQINKVKNNHFLFSPIVIFSLLLIIITALSFSSNKWINTFLERFDGLLFFLTGALGIVLIFMWTATDHAMCKNNYNLLWALPTHSIMAFFINRKNDAVKKYFAITAILLSALLTIWFFLPQQMNNGLIPVVLLLIFRSATKFYKK